MAKTKQDWLKEAKALGLAVTPTDKIADIRSAIEASSSKKKPTTKDNPVEKISESTVTEEAQPQETNLAKAGRRSKKGLEEAEEKAAKEARKQSGLKDESAKVVNKGPAPKTRSVLERRGKKYREAATKIDRTQEYPLSEAINLAVNSTTTKFDATVELHIRLNVDPKQSDQNIRDTVTLPHGTGKTVRVGVFAPSDTHAKAKEAGADIVGEQDFLKKLDNEELDFDVLIATPQVMSQLGKYAKLLGPKGLMPNPKSGTVTTNVAAAVKAAKTGQIEFRIDAQGIVHAPVGKVSFGSDKLVENTQTLISGIRAAKPSSVKGQYVESIFVTTTMGPSVRVSN